MSEATQIGVRDRALDGDQAQTSHSRPGRDTTPPAGRDTPSPTGRDTAPPGVRRAGRADQVRNRKRLVDAARAAVAQRGTAVPLTEVARRADLSPATLYRHFPDRATLLVEVFEREVGHCEDILDRAAESAEPGTAIFRALRDVAALEAAQPGVMMTLVDQPGVSDGLTSFRQQASVRLRQLVERARASGSVRDDLRLEDLYLVLVAIKAVAQTDRATALHRTLRVVDLFEEGCTVR